MSMSTQVVGFRPPDEKWQRMKAIYVSCMAENIEVPLEVYKFFDDSDPRDYPGMEVSLRDAVTPYKGEESEGFEVDVSKIPDGVNIIRFYNSW